ncbi:hypothetical protein ISF08_19975 [Pseudomonas aeruginosa]|uniref:Mor transcription activator family protein n=1 Tax=Pseudomonas TaxID=286 RepID=UPI000AAE4DE3|nr:MULTISPECIES: Mor transcription activator family protein [Pseudomonas]EIU2834169.1 hypothetical protein [Pseudomonas aeruginosa]EIU2869359.1 hypothetical protein [Pseudomonas aeruginosa]EJT5136771.1 hypothetical protein [Pseudomonas aeruginosa]EKW4793387.1 hypothetical protein [Pseudomonas aeruginosa]ELG4635640.1 hypothetical protein [Pseudomonas aeruginosa]
MPIMRCSRCSARSGVRPFSPAGHIFTASKILGCFDPANIDAGIHALVGDEMAKSKRAEVRRNEFLADVADLTMRIMKRYGLDDSQAQAAADNVADDLAESWGGQYITVPKDINYRSAKRRQAIVEAFDGSNHSELAAEFGLSVNYIYKILKGAQV